MSIYTIVTDCPFEEMNNIQTDYFGLKGTLNQILTCSPYIILEMKYGEKSILNEKYKGFSDEENQFINALKRCGVLIESVESFGIDPQFELLALSRVVMACKMGGCQNLKLRKNADKKFEITYSDELIEYYKRVAKQDYSESVFFYSKLKKQGYY